MQQNRLASIDQLRGYAIFGMIFVNILGLFQVMPWMFKHHHYGMSYADTIAPLFVFVVGIGFRMSVTRGFLKEGKHRTYRRMIRRYLIIIGLGILYGRFDFQTDIWDALMDIGCAGMLSLPFIGRSVGVRVFAAVFFLGFYQLIFSCTPYGAWTMGHSINGGPMGPFAYAFVLLFGTLLTDLLHTRNPRRIIISAGTLSIALALLGWLLRLEWPDLKPEWPFSQYAMSMPYVLYSTGLAFLAFLFFYLLCDVFKFKIPQLSILGMNPLVIYIFQAVLYIIVGETVPDDASYSIAILCFIGVYSLCYALAWTLNWRGIIVKI